MAKLKLNPTRKLIGTQCSGRLFLANLGLLRSDLTTKLWMQETGVKILNKGTIAITGGYLASQYLAFWGITRTLGIDAKKEALYYVVPMGKKDAYVTRKLANISPYLV